MGKIFKGTLSLQGIDKEKKSGALKKGKE